MCEALRELFKDEIEQWFLEGEAKGRTEAKKAIAINMYKSQMDVEEIAKITEASVEEVSEWLGLTLVKEYNGNS